MNKAFFPFVLFVVSSSLPLAPAAAAEPLPCQPFIGERFTFAVGWEFIEAGTAEMSYTRLGSNGYRFQTYAKSNSFFDMFKKVRDVMTSEGVCVDGKMQSTLFELKQLENVYRAQKKTEFDWQHGKVKYTHNGEVTHHDVPAGYLDVLDAFTLARTLDLKPGKEYPLPIFDSKELYDVTVAVEKKTEMVEAPWGGKVECLIIEPKLKTEGIFSSKGKIRIWLTNDKRRIPLRLTAAIRFGRIVGNLIDYRMEP